MSRPDGPAYDPEFDGPGPDWPDLSPAEQRHAIQMSLR